MALTKREIDHHLPLSEATFYIMALLTEPRHGYAVMQEVAALTGGEVAVGPGTIYGAFTALEREKLIVFVAEEQRRKSYRLTARGREVLTRQLARLRLMVSTAQRLGLATTEETP